MSNKPTRKKPRLPAVIAVLIVLVGAWLGLDSRNLANVASLIEENAPGYYSVTNVVDGDTIEVDMNGRTERIRFIGLDTPEKNHPKKPVQCFAKAASQHLEELIDTRPVRLEADPTNQNRDRYDRLLRYVFLENGLLLNARQIEDGYGFAYTAFPFIKMDEFRRLEKVARETNRGLWGSCRIEQEDGYINTEPS